MSRLAQNTFYLTLASVGQKILAFVFFIFLARVMQPENTGVYFLSLSIIVIFGVIADFGITPVVIREIAKRPENAKYLIRHALALKIPLILLAIVGSYVSALILGYDPIIIRLILLAAFILLADSISLLFYGVLRGYHQLTYESLGIFIGQTFSVVAGGVILWLHPSLPWLVVALGIGSIFNMLYAAQKIVRRLGARVLIPLWERGSLAALLKVALPFALAAIFVKVYSYVDTIFLSKFLDATAVGIYSVAYKFTYAFQFIPLAFVAALYPTFSEQMNNDRAQLAPTFDRAVWYLALIATPIVFGIWAIAPELVQLAGSGYAESAAVLQLLIIVLLPIFLDFPIGSLLNAADKQATKTAIMGATMVLNIVLNALLIPTQGVMGAAWAGVVSFWFLFLCGLWFVPKIIPTYRFRSLLRITVPILCSGFVMAAAVYVLKPILGIFLVVPLAAVIYVGCLFLTKSLAIEHLRSLRAVIASGAKQSS